MKIFRPTFVLTFLSVNLLAFSIPSEVIGTYTGISKEKKMDNLTGKMKPYGNYGITLKFNADETMDVTHVDYGFEMTDNYPIINGKNFLFGYVYDNNSYFIVRGKFAGKGKKVRANLAWKIRNNYYEGKIAATKL